MTDKIQGMKNLAARMKSLTLNHSPIVAFLNKLIVFRIESFFFWYGRHISEKPLKFIILCTILALISLPGLLNLKEEKRPIKLWVPEDSYFIDSLKWQIEIFPEKKRSHFVIYEAENILTKKAVRKMLKIHNLIENIEIEGTTWRDICSKVPIIEGAFFKRKKRSTAKIKKLKRAKRNLPWWMEMLPRADYCEVIDYLPQGCIEHSLLEIWGYDETTINSLTDEDVLKAVNEANYSSIYRINTNFTKFLGGIERDLNGRIIKAKSAGHIWVSEINKQDILNGDYAKDIWTGVIVDRKGFEWEKEVISQLTNDIKNSEDIKLHIAIASSFSRIVEGTIEADMLFVGIGFILVFTYTQIMLGKCNMVEQRPLLTVVGLVGIVFSYMVAISVGSILGIIYGPLNKALPFLLIGLGVDDIFVIIQSWDNLKNNPESKLELPLRIAHALKNSGVSITITSLTDAAAFAIGAFTIIPALRSFCLYASIGIIALYFFQATFFVAWLTYDQKRLEDNRQGLLWCIRYKNYSPNKFSQKEVFQSLFSNYLAKAVIKPKIKLLVLILTFFSLCLSLWGVCNLKQEFDPTWVLPKNSHLREFLSVRTKYYPSRGFYSGDVIIGNFNITELPKLDYMVDKIKKNEHIIEVDSWYDKYKIYWKEIYENIENAYNNETFFYDSLSEFLYSPEGFKYKFLNFKFHSNISCTNPTPKIAAFTVNFRHKPLLETPTKIEAMEQIKSIVKESNFSGGAFAYSIGYAGTETNKIIEVELYRNIGMALGIVWLTTFLLICSIRTSLMVVLCVVLTLINVMAVMHWWGLTIDTASCVSLQISIGLCVDFSVHIAHNFMMQKGTRNERSEKAISKIGLAVFNGGISTILAFSPLSASKGHTFITFFKIFTSLCVFGLYNSLICFPVMLSLIGPPSYTKETEENSKSSITSDENEAENMGEMLSRKSVDEKFDNEDNESNEVLKVLIVPNNLNEEQVDLNDKTYLRHCSISL